MAGRKSMVEPTSPASSGEFVREDSVRFKDKDLKPSFSEHTSYQGLEDLDINDDASHDGRDSGILLLPSKAFSTRNRFLHPFASHAENPSIRRRTYGLLHGHSFDTRDHAEHNVTGWSSGVRWATIGTALVFIANTVFLISTVAVYGNDGGIGTLYSGNCNVVQNYDTWIHILINFLSTVLLGASSYVMQCLNSPSREQLDRTHAQGKSMDIGMPSFRNARRVGWRQTRLWILLGISAMPLHLFWNSAIFSTLEANQYDMFVVPSDFNATDKFVCDLADGCDNGKKLWEASKIPGGLEYLDNAKCIDTYSASFLTGRRNILLITSNLTRGWQEGSNSTEPIANDSVFGIIMSRMFDVSVGSNEWDPTTWWCDSSMSFVPSLNNRSDTFTSPWYDRVANPYQNTCRSSTAIKEAQDLSVLVRRNVTRDGVDSYNFEDTYLYAIDYCLSEIVPQVCQLQSAHYVWIIVIACNAIKFCCMFFAAKALDSSPLVVIGDAVASYLANPDPSTEGNCLMSAHTAGKPAPSNGRVWKHTQKFWLQSSSVWSWGKTLFLCISVLIIITTTLILVGTWRNNGVTSWHDMSFGGVSPQTILSFQNFMVDPASFSTLISVLLFVNCPQVVFSSLYFMYNSLLTSMLAMQEFSRFAYRRRPLRVSSPVGKQRYTYWLQLPYKYSFPLLGTSGLMHWFISQSLFLARIQVIDEYGNKIQSTNLEENNSLYTLPGYSPKAVVAALSLGAAMVIVIFGIGFRRHPGGVPFVTNNSMAISACCHPPEGDIKAATEAVMWGAVRHQIGNEPGHCTFTSRHVEPPFVGQRYAGWKRTAGKGSDDVTD